VSPVEESILPVKTTCPYCGVGCGVIATPGGDGGFTISGDPEHPANFGRLCSKGAALAETLDLDNRLLTPQVAGKPVGWDSALDTVAHGFQRIIEEHGPNAVAFYVSGQLLTEDYYIANKLMKGFIGSANIDTNSRLCMSSAVAGYKRAFGSDTVPCAYDDLERAKLVILVGSNTAWCHPVLYQRLLKAKKDNPDLMVVVIDPRKTVTADIADMHLAIRPGTDVTLFNGLLIYLWQAGERNDLFVDRCTEGLDVALAVARETASDPVKVANACGIEPDLLERFYRLFARTERAMTVFSQGVNQSSSGTDKVNSIINCHLFTGRIGRPGMGPFSLTGQPNAMGGREVGGLANMLAAHMEIDNAAHRETVQKFWQSPVIADRQGLKAIDLFNAIGDGKIKAVWIMATNPLVSLPDANRVREALRKCELVVVSDVVKKTDTTELAHVLLPALAWGEKDGTVTNSERCISRQRPFLAVPGEARPDWWMVSEVAKRLGHGPAFGYQSADEIFREHASLSSVDNNGVRDFDIGALAKITSNEYDDLLPIQWPVTPAAPKGTVRMFTSGEFFTPSGRARFIATSPQAPANSTGKEYPLVMNTGRIRDQWHTMTRTGKSARLSSHLPEPYAEIHPDDARASQIETRSLVRVTSRWGEVIVRAQLSTEQQRGSVFVPMHWNSQFASHGRVDAAVNPAVDPVSGEPEFKHTPVRIEPYRPLWHGFLLSRRQLRIKEAGYWVAAKGQGIWRYDLAGEQLPEDWAQSARALLCAADKDVGWIEYFDNATRQYRGARLVSNRLESCIFIGPDPALPPRDWLEGLFASDNITGDERSSLLSGLPPKGQSDRGRVVCACFGIGEKTIAEAIRTEGLESVEAIGRLLQAGTNCGSCIPELKQLLRAITTASAA
jgi:assimilatory nitrate reductase catalytic subunit